jgi:hypothetical protein
MGGICRTHKRNKNGKQNLAGNPEIKDYLGYMCTWEVSIEMYLRN